MSEKELILKHAPEGATHYVRISGAWTYLKKIGNAMHWMSGKPYYYVHCSKIYSLEGLK